MAQHPMKVVLLDLDGTLTKSDGGIIASVVKTFEELGRLVPDDAELHRFIGPAIIESLRRNHVPEDELDRAVTIYRSYYADRAVFDDPNEPGNKVPGRLRTSCFPVSANSCSSCVPTAIIWRWPAASPSTNAFRSVSISI